MTDKQPFININIIKMKKLKNPLIATYMLMTLGMVSCKKADTPSNQSSVSATTIIQQGTWRVTLYNDHGTDETYYFSGYNFKFNSNGTLTGTKSSALVNGSWSKGLDDSQYKLVLNFGTNAPFDKLNNDWQIISQSATKISLNDVSGGGGGTDLLSFEKN